MDREEPLILRLNRLRTLPWLAISLGLTVVGIGRAASGGHTISGLFVAGFFGIGSLALLLTVLRGPRLVLGQDGFTVETLLRSRSKTYKWSDVDQFIVARVATRTWVPGPKAVFFDFSPAYREEGAVRAIARQLAGHEAMLPLHVGPGPEDLAQLMNQWRTGRRSV
jgi:hypothetical protein